MRRNRNRFGNSVYWISAFVGATVFSVAMLFGVLFASKNHSLARMELENSYKRSFYEMADSINDIEVNLSKMAVSLDDEQTVEIAEDIRIQSQMAQSNLNQLPVGSQTAFELNKFLNQVGDWCAGYCHALLTDGETSIYEEQLEIIQKTTKDVSFQVGEISATYGNGGKSIIGALKHRGIKAAGDFVLASDSLNHSVIEYPELIYDGPFSDSIDESCFKALENLPIIPQADAFEKVKHIFKELGLKNAKFLGVSTRPSAYEYSADISGGQIYFSISERGAKLISATTSLVPAAKSQKAGYSIDKEQAKELALSYAQRCDYSNDFVPVWYNASNGIAYVNLAPKIDGIIYYPDLVKVKISLGDGKLIALEATGFCSNNCSRTLTPTIDEKTAKSLASPKLEISACRLAVIPLDCKQNGQTERLCYEIAASYKNFDYFVYIDATTSKQHKIMRLVNSDQGEMVI